MIYILNYILIEEVNKFNKSKQKFGKIILGDDYFLYNSNAVNPASHIYTTEVITLNDPSALAVP